jgi:membrane-associated protease RseP (regulator of RpoE activity)
MVQNGVRVSTFSDNASSPRANTHLSRRSPQPFPARGQANAAWPRNQRAGAAIAGARWLPTWGLCALLAACGPPTWAGGIHALLAWSERAVRVTEVPASGPSARAGLRAGDVILAIDGKPVAGLTSREVQRLLTGEVGSTVELEIERDGRRERVRVERAPYETTKRS